ncbi:hypothetical protein [uncultured Sphingomonas sp.]|uniref:hypothetical protein n=1 Tax=uncultured Sphingomonas sp. TaxID=158754 RepID=UPI00258D5A6D|nr:hypothetical protein [uncultured Sphingomonas sp.]
MKKFALMLAGLGVAMTALPAAAQPWQSVNQRQAQIERRIDQGIRNGSLSRREAVNLRAEFRQIANLEQRYRRSNGLSMQERRDLDRRMTALSNKVRIDWHDRNGRPGYRR